MTLKERVQDILRRKKIPAMQMEQDLKLAKGYISKLDKSSPGADKLLAISNYLDVSTDYLLTGKETVKTSTEGTEYYFNDDTASVAQEIFENSELRALFDAARNVKPKDLQIAAEMLRRFKETNPDG